MYLSIHSPTEDLHLDCSCVLAIMNKAWCAGFRVDVSFQIIWINNQEHDCWIIQWEYVCPTKTCPTVSQSLRIIYTLGSNDRALLQLSILTNTWCPRCLDLSHSLGCAGISLSNLPFSETGIISLIFCHLFIYLGQVSIQLFCSFFNWVVYILES